MEYENTTTNFKISGMHSLGQYFKQVLSVKTKYLIEVLQNDVLMISIKKFLTKGKFELY